MPTAICIFANNDTMSRNDEVLKTTSGKGYVNFALVLGSVLKGFSIDSQMHSIYYISELSSHIYLSIANGFVIRESILSRPDDSHKPIRKFISAVIW